MKGHNKMKNKSLFIFNITRLSHTESIELKTFDTSNLETRVNNIFISDYGKLQLVKTSNSYIYFCI